MDKRKKHFLKPKAEEIRKKPPTKTQKRNQIFICSYGFKGGGRKYYRIIRADESTKFYKIFTAMLDDFDRQDVLDLYRLEDEIWKAQQDYTLISWRLYDSCGIHLLLMDTGITIHMMVEKKYPLTPEMLSRMLSGKLEVVHECEMAYELLRFTRSRLKK
ncbi:hypothetical protein Tco_1359991 [Tanacetum coccineum]